MVINESGWIIKENQIRTKSTSDQSPCHDHKDRKKEKEGDEHAKTNTGGNTVEDMAPFHLSNGPNSCGSARKSGGRGSVPAVVDSAATSGVAPVEGGVIGVHFWWKKGLYVFESAFWTCLGRNEDQPGFRVLRVGEKEEKRSAQL
jgi:hypothetical protein